MVLTPGIVYEKGYTVKKCYTLPLNALGCALRDLVVGAGGHMGAGAFGRLGAPCWPRGTTGQFVATAVAWGGAAGSRFLIGLGPVPSRSFSLAAP